jgi:penicillin-binding protein 2
MRLRKQWLVLGFILLTGCNRLSTPIISAVPSPPASFSPIATPAHEEIATATPVPTATPIPTATPVTPPSPAETAVTFLKAWEKDNYTRMYALLTASSQATFSLEDFMKHQQNLAEAATVHSMETEMLSMLQNGMTAQVAYRLTLQTGLWGDLVRETNMELHFDDSRWQVDWADEMFLPELAEGNTLVLEHQIPARAPIYDRYGLALADQGSAIAIGVVPGEVTDEAALLQKLTDLLGLQPERLKQKYTGQPLNWYIPLGEVSKEVWDQQAARFTDLSGWRVRPIDFRFYPFGGVAPQLVGYTAPIFAEEVADYKARGYRGDEKVGRAGLERWGESYLAGRHGGKLDVVTPGGQIRTTLAETPAQPGQAIYTTLDRDLQMAAQAALGSFKGAIVILNPQTGEVLAMVSNPTYDPNLFQPTSLNIDLLNQALKNPGQPFFNRATQGQYPPGSVFKIVTMAAALDSGQYTPDTIYYCGSEWDELGPGNVKKDWTVAAGLPAQGNISLSRALTVPCNPYFYHVGLDLYQVEPDFIPETAHAFGLGQPTGIKVVAEATGLIPDSAWKQATLGQLWTAGDSVNMAIGQGFVLVTPLQMAVMIAAVSNGGTLYRPHVIKTISAPDAGSTFEVEPEALGQLPLSPEALNALQNALQAVTSQPGGTANHRFLGLSIPVAGKTGTAEAPGRSSGLPHSWFVGYSLANDPNKPDIALGVLVENVGEGSAYAAPIFRRVIESYFFGQPTTPYPWEVEVGVQATPPLTTTQVGLPIEVGTPTPTPQR